MQSCNQLIAAAIQAQRKCGGRVMSKPEIAQRSPYAVDVGAGKSYWWCACGKSRKQPFCDGSHKGSEFNPVEYKATENKTVYFCGCKQTSTQPLCDSTHQKL
jgi:CDGSH-type Zn-finger protein